MFMAMENLIIVQHWVVLQYATIHGGGYQAQIYRFVVEDFVDL